MISRALVALGLLILLVDCLDFTVTGVALIGAVVVGAGWVLNHLYGWLVADDETAAIYAAIDEELERRGL